MSASDGNKPNQRRIAALLLASGRSCEEAAAGAGIDQKTLYNWRRQPGFQRLVARHRDTIVSEVVGKISALAIRAVATLDGLLDDPLPRVRLGSAKVVLESLMRATDLIEVQRRLGALEQALAEKKP
jgi:transposase-like protein